MNVVTYFIYQSKWRKHVCVDVNVSNGDHFSYDRLRITLWTIGLDGIE